MVEKTTQTFKGHFKAILCGFAYYFPMNLWDRLIPQAGLTCNLLHQSNVDPKVSAQAYAFGPHNFNRMPLAPMVCAVKIHEKPSKRKTCGFHSVDGWYLQTSPHHYRSYEVWSKQKGAELILDTVFLKHKHITNSTVLPEDAVVQAAKELTAALKGCMPSSLEVSTVKELEKLDNILNQTSVTYKESIDDAPPPRRVSEETATPQRVTRTQTPYHSPPYEKEPGMEPVGENEMVVTSPPLSRMDPQPNTNITSKNDGDATEKSTRAKERTLTQEVMLSCTELTDTPATQRELALRKSPMILLCEISTAVLDGETRKMMEYCHLRISPRYREV